MRKILLGLVVLGPLASLQADEEEWEVGADYLLMRRTKVFHHRLVQQSTTKIIPLDPTPLPLTPVGPRIGKERLDTGNLLNDFDWSSGVRGFFTYNPNECSSFELTYTYFTPWHGSEKVKGHEDLFFPFDHPAFALDFINADEAKGKYRSEWMDAEINYWWHVTPRYINAFSFAWIFSGRWIYLRENFSLSFTRPPNTSDYRTRTTNRLFGAQLGANFEWNPTCHWTWTVNVKGGGFLNDAHAHVFLGDEDNTVTLVNYSKDKWDDSWLIQGKLQLTYWWNSTFNLHIAYEGMLLSGIAQAPDQIQRKTTTITKHRIRTRDDVALDGASIGMSFDF